MLFKFDTISVSGVLADFEGIVSFSRHVSPRRAGSPVAAMNVNASLKPMNPPVVVFDDFPRGEDGDYLVFVGVDGGGTGTDCLVRIVDAEKHAAGERKGAWLADTCTGVVMTSRSRTGAANANSVGFEQAFENVSTAVYEAVGSSLERCLAHAGTREQIDRATRSLFRRGETAFASGENPSGEDRKRKRTGNRYRFRLAGVTLGIAGCDSPANQNEWRDAILLSPREAPEDGAFAPETPVVENDAVVALARATNGTARGGALLVAGTGTIAFAISHAGKRARAMGFGPAFDDPGSGHYLGTKALAATARALDGRPFPSVEDSLRTRRETSDVVRLDDHDHPTRSADEARIARAVLAKLGFAVTTRAEEGDEVDVFDRRARRESRDAARENLLRWAYGAGPAPARGAAAAWDRVASLAPILVDEHKRRNGVASGIVRDCATTLAENLVSAIRDARDDDAFCLSKSLFDDDASRAPPEPFVVALAGGLFEDRGARGYRALVLDAVVDRLKRVFAGSIRVYDEDSTPDGCGDVRGPPAGAVAMAVRSFEAWRRRRRRGVFDAPGDEVRTRDVRRA